MAHTVTHNQKHGYACHTGKSLKRDCCCTVAASKCAFEDWCGTGSRYWYTATERKQKNYVWGVPMGLVGSGSAESDPVVARQILRAHSTRHGARPGPILAPWFIGGPRACLAAESARNNLRQEEQSFACREKVSFVNMHASGAMRALSRRL